MVGSQIINAIFVGLSIAVMVAYIFRENRSHTRLVAIRVKTDPYSRRSQREQKESPDEGLSDEELLIVGLSFVISVLLVMTAYSF